MDSATNINRQLHLRHLATVVNHCIIDCRWSETRCLQTVADPFNCSTGLARLLGRPSHQCGTGGMHAPPRNTISWQLSRLVTSYSSVFLQAPAAHCLMACPPVQALARAPAVPHLRATSQCMASMSAICIKVHSFRKCQVRHYICSKSPNACLKLLNSLKEQEHDGGMAEHLSMPAPSTQAFV